MFDNLASSSVKTIFEKRIKTLGETLGVNTVYFDGFKRLPMETAVQLREGTDKIVVNSLWKDKLSGDQIERLLSVKIQQRRTELMRRFNVIDFQSLAESRDFKRVQKRVGDFYDRAVKKNILLPYHRQYYQSPKQVLSLLRGYQLYLEQKKRGGTVITRPQEFIESFKPRDLKFLDESYLETVSKNLYQETALVGKDFGLTRGGIDLKTDSLKLNIKGKLFMN